MANKPKDEGKTEEVFVQLIITRIAPDRTPYKQYGIELTPMRLAVSIPVPSKELTVVTKPTEEGEVADYYVLTLNGLGVLTAKVADMIDNLHNQHLLDLQKGTR